MASQQVQSNIIHDVGYLATKAVRYDRYINNMAKAMRTYREKIRQDTDKHTVMKEKARSYMEKYREEIKKDPVAYEAFRERQRQNQKRYREKMKAEIDIARGKKQQTTQTYTQTEVKNQLAC